MASVSSIDGIVSGMNTQGIIDAMMKMEQGQVDLYSARQAEYTQKLTSWQSINSYMLGFKTQLDILAKPSLWNTKSVVSSNEDAIVATSSGSSANGTYFLSVNQLARNHQIASQGYSESSAIVGTGSIEIKLGSGTSKTITLDSGNNSLESLKEAINNADAGVTAAIINDGSKNNSYRLILTANETGSANQISVISSLSGGTAPDFTTASFDTAEKLIWASTSTSNPFLGSSAHYTGSTNKTYTFTVGGSGAQTVGSGPITLNWTDGTNSGTVAIDMAGSDAALTGAGSDGLTINLGSGVVNAGDSFQIQALAPTLQAGQDAIMQLGSTDSGGSPIQITSGTNKITTLIDGVSLDLKQATTTAVMIKVDNDYSSIAKSAEELISKYNAFADFVDQQMAYNSGTGKAGVLLGESSLINLLSDVRTSITSSIAGLAGPYTKLSDVGIKFNTKGRLEFSSATFTSKLDASPEDIRKLFLAAGTSSNSYIKYISSGAKTIARSSGYDVDITKAPEQGAFAAGSIPNPATTPLVIDSTNSNMQIKINGYLSNTISLEQRAYSTGAELAEEIENKINADISLGSNDVVVEWVDEGANGHLKITSALWGANSKVEISGEPLTSAHTILGFTNGTSTVGVDVEGTINGEPATGVGQILTGKDGNATTDGMKLEIDLTAGQLVDGAEGRVTLTKGFAALISDKMSRYTDPSTGILSSKAGSIQKQVDNLKDTITRMQTQLEKKRESLYQQFRNMENTLAKLQSQQMYLSAAITSLGGSSSASSTPKPSTSS